MYLEPTQDSGRALVERNISGPVSMLNLLRFREVADYSSHPKLAPPTPISGREAYDRYVVEATPHVAAAGSDVTFLGDGGRYLIGPPEDRWDLVMLVRHESVEAFFSMAQNDAYLEVLGHRTAALEDSRLLPIVEHQRND
ncbi:MAG: DUF1330 domain-containing protein [Acidimicrobiia bacterium]|jgi:uncharacterized protein (DUF1330 family)